MYSIVGHCPKCGAPIYVTTAWQGVTPPPNTFTCGCNNGNVREVGVSTAQQWCRTGVIGVNNLTRNGL